MYRRDSSAMATNDDGSAWCDNGFDVLWARTLTASFWDAGDAMDDIVDASPISATPSVVCTMTLCSNDSRGNDGSSTRTPSGPETDTALLLPLPIGDRTGGPIDRVGSYDDGAVGEEYCPWGCCVVLIAGSCRCGCVNLRSDDWRSRLSLNPSNALIFLAVASERAPWPWPWPLPVRVPVDLLLVAVRRRRR